MIKLGNKVKDIITGFEGIAIGRCEYLTGCAQYGIAPPAEKGEIPPAQWFDEGRIEYVDEGVMPKQVQADAPGGPNRDCPH